MQASREAYEAKCEAARKAKAQAEVDACTFKPAGITAKARHAASRILDPPPSSLSNAAAGGGTGGGTKLTSLDKELYEHCTFRPATNTHFSSGSKSVTHRIDCSPPLGSSLSDLGRHLAGSELRRSASYTQRARACSEAGSEAGGSMAGSVASLAGVSYNAQNGSFRRGYAAANNVAEPPPPPPQPTMSAAEADAAAELQAAEGAAAAAALMAEMGGEVEAMAEPLNAQQLEAKFYADLAAELRDADF